MYILSGLCEMCFEFTQLDAVAESISNVPQVWRDLKWVYSLINM